MRNTQLLLVTVASILLPAYWQPAAAQHAQVIVGNAVGCKTPGVMVKLLRQAYAADFQGFNALFAEARRSGECVALRRGERVIVLMRQDKAAMVQLREGGPVYYTESAYFSPTTE